MTKFNSQFFLNKKILITGHTGFKGSWLTRILVLLGADVTGYALEPIQKRSLFNLLKLDKQINSVVGDIRDLKHLNDVFNQSNPEFVIHLAAQPLVLNSYNDPVYTYETNVIGTVNICDCVRRSSSVKSFLNVTTDKVYNNKEWMWGYRENEELNGFDPYSNSKSCSELVTATFRRCFSQKNGVAISTARAGNVIGGGDFSPDRIIPDCARAAFSHSRLILRHPNSIRPYQHVLEPLFAYLLILKEQFENPNISGAYNVGPDGDGCVTTSEIARLFQKYYGGFAIDSTETNGPHEANFLKLDCTKIKSTLGWKPTLDIDTGIKFTAEWYKTVDQDDTCATSITDDQIGKYLNLLTY